MSLTEFQALPEPERTARVAAAANALRAAGADFVIDTVADLGPVREEIAGRIAAGDRSLGV